MQQCNSCSGGAQVPVNKRQAGKQTQEEECDSKSPSGDGRCGTENEAQPSEVLMPVGIFPGVGLGWEPEKSSLKCGQDPGLNGLGSGEAVFPGRGSLWDQRWEAWPGWMVMLVPCWGEGLAQQLRGQQGVRSQRALNEEEEWQWMLRGRAGV